MLLILVLIQCLLIDPLKENIIQAQRKIFTVLCHQKAYAMVRSNKHLILKYTTVKRNPMHLIQAKGSLIINQFQIHIENHLQSVRNIHQVKRNLRAL